jgi:hypothetical protein
MGVGASCKTGLSQRMSDFVAGYTHTDERVRQQLQQQRQERPFTKTSTKSTIPHSASYPQPLFSARSQRSSSQRAEHTPSRLALNSTGSAKVFEEQLNCAICDPDTYEPNGHKKDEIAVNEPKPSANPIDPIDRTCAAQPKWLSSEQTRNDLVRTDSLLDNARRVSSKQKKSQWIEGWRSASEQAQHHQQRARKSIERLDAQKEQFNERIDEVGAYLNSIHESSETLRSPCKDAQSYRTGSNDSSVAVTTVQPPLAEEEETATTVPVGLRWLLSHELRAINSELNNFFVCF